MYVTAIKAVGRERRQFKKRGAGIDQKINPLTRQHLAARGVPCARDLAAAAGDLLELFAQLRNEPAHDVGVACKFLGFGIDRGMERHGL